MQGSSRRRAERVRHGVAVGAELVIEEGVEERSSHGAGRMTRSRDLSDLLCLGSEESV